VHGRVSTSRRTLDKTSLQLARGTAHVKTNTRICVHTCSRIPPADVSGIPSSSAAAVVVFDRCDRIVAARSLARLLATHGPASARPPPKRVAELIARAARRGVSSRLLRATAGVRNRRRRARPRVASEFEEINRPPSVVRAITFSSSSVP
jgi:hypothetical protein